MKVGSLMVNYSDSFITENELKIFSNEWEYEGEWVNDKREGLGIINYSDGRKYNGNWK